MFFHQLTGVPLPKTMDRKMNFCTQLVEDLTTNKMRPELIIQDRFRCSDEWVFGDQCFKLCNTAILGVKGEDGEPLYSLEKIDDDGIHVENWHDETGMQYQVRHPFYYYRLNPGFQPSPY